MSTVMLQCTARLTFALTMLAVSFALSASPLSFRFESSGGAPVSDVVLTAGGAAPASTKAMAIMDQQDKAFRPYVLPIRVGTEVSFPNSDQIRHHVYSFSAAKRFEIRLYHGEPGETVVFNEPGVAALGCNIHDNMVGFIYVTDQTHFAKSDHNGEITLELPDQVRRINVWHPDLSFDSSKVLSLPLSEVARDGEVYVINLGIATPNPDPQAIDPADTGRFQQFLPD